MLLISASITVIQEIEEEDRLWQNKARRRQEKEISKRAESREEENVSDSESLPAGKADKPLSTHDEKATPTTIRRVTRAFY